MNPLTNPYPPIMNNIINKNKWEKLQEMEEYIKIQEQNLQELAEIEREIDELLIRYPVEKPIEKTKEKKNKKFFFKQQKKQNFIGEQQQIKLQVEQTKNPQQQQQTIQLQPAYQNQPFIQDNQEIMAQNSEYQKYKQQYNEDDLIFIEWTNLQVQNSIVENNFQENKIQQQYKQNFQQAQKISQNEQQQHQNFGETSQQYFDIENLQKSIEKMGEAINQIQFEFQDLRVEIREQFQYVHQLRKENQNLRAEIREQMSKGVNQNQQEVQNFRIAQIYNIKSQLEQLLLQYQGQTNQESVIQNQDHEQ